MTDKNDYFCVAITIREFSSFGVLTILGEKKAYTFDAIFECHVW